MNIRLPHVATALFVFTEAFAWYVALHALGSAWTRDGFSVLIDKLQRVGTFGDEVRVRTALAIAHDAALTATGGPTFLSVLAAAIGAFAFVRWMTKQQVPLPIAAAVGTAVTLLAFHVLLHLSVTGDLRIWESSAVVRMVGPGTAVFGNRLEAPEFIVNPDPSQATRESVTVTVFGLAAVWIRFLLAGRGAFAYERVLRSFGFWFGALLFIALFASVTRGVGTLGYILAYFVLGALTLAVAHATRAQTQDDSLRRTAPWLISLALTLGAVTGVALLFGLLTFINAGVIFAPVVDFIVFIAGRIAFVILYPIALVLTWIFEAIFQGRTLQLDNLARNLRDMEPPQADTGTQMFPNWLSTAFRAFVLVITTWLLYRLGYALFGNRRRTGTLEEYAELRVDAGPLEPPSLFGGLFRRRGGDGADGAWLRRHAIYQLFGRVVQAAQARGVRRAPGDTPIEFADVAAGNLGAPPFAPIALAFDQSRYGRHFPESGEVDALEREFTQWEREHPVVRQDRE